MYYYYNTRTTNEKSPIILYFTADTIKNVELQIRDKKKEYPKMFKNNDLIKVFIKESDDVDADLTLFNSYIFKRSRLNKCPDNISTIFVTQ